LWQRLPRAAGFGEALHDLVSVPGAGVPECNLTVETNPVERRGGRVAFCPPRIGEVLLWRVRDGACPLEEREHQDRSYTLQQWAALVEHAIRLPGPPAGENERRLSLVGMICRQSLQVSLLSGRIGRSAHPGYVTLLVRARLRTKLTIEMMSAPRSAARNRSTRNPKPRPCATQLVKSSMNALITKINKPRVRISNGSDRRIRIGRMTAFIMPKIKATTSSVTQSFTVG